MKVGKLRSRLTSVIAHTLTYLILVSLVVALTIPQVTYAQSWMSYDLPIGKYVVNVKLRLEAGNAGTTWDLSKPLKLDYSVGLARFGSSLGSINVLLNITLVCGSESVTNTYLLGNLSTEMPSTSGYLMLYPSGGIVECVLSGGSYVLVEPKVALISSSNLSRTYTLAPYRLYASISDIKNTFVGRCLTRLSNSSVIEVCVKAPYIWSASKVSNPVTISVSTYGTKAGSAVVSIKAGNAIVASRELSISKGVIEEVLNVPTSLVMSICTQQRTQNVKSNVSKGNIVKSTQQPGTVLNVSLTPLTTALGTVNVPLSIRCLTTYSPIKLVMIPSASSIVAGESLSIRLVVTNPNNYPVRLTKLVVTDNNRTVIDEVLTTTVSPQGTFTKVIKLVLKEAGNHVVVATLKYSLSGREDVIKSKLVVLVTRALHIELSKESVTEGNDVLVSIAAFKPLKGVQLIAKELSSKKNLTKVIAYVGDFPAPTVRKVRLVITLGPGNYSIYAVTKDGLRSNEELLKVLPKQVQNKTVKSVTKTAATTATKTTVKQVTMTKATATKTTTTARAKAGITLRVRLLNSTVVPKGTVVAEVMVIGSVSKPEFKLYKYEGTFTPPWILQPTARFTQVKPGTYRLVFKAPSSEGSYEYKVVLISGGKEVAQATFRITVGKASKASLPIKAALLPPEILIPLIGTVALASIILLRRFRSGVGGRGKAGK